MLLDIDPILRAARTRDTEDVVHFPNMTTAARLSRDKIGHVHLPGDQIPGGVQLRPVFDLRTGHDDPHFVVSELDVSYALR